MTCGFPARYGLLLGFVSCVLILGGCRWPGSQDISLDPTKAYIDAKAELRQAAEDPDPFTRSHALEALSHALGTEAGSLFKEALSDSSPSVQFAAAMAIGDVQYGPAGPDLVRKAEAEGPDKRVYAAVIYALHRLGEDKYTGDLVRLLLHPREPEIRANAALVMGRMGEPSAIGPLKSLQDNEQSDLVKVNLLEALSLLGDIRSSQMLEAYARGPDVNIRLVAIPALGRSGTTDALLVLEELLGRQHPPRARIAAAIELAKLKRYDRRAYDLCVEAAEVPRRMLGERPVQPGAAVSEVEAYSLQRLAAMGLGWMHRPEAVNVLHPLLKSPDGGVRVAAAMGILRTLREDESARAAGDAEGAAEPSGPRDAAAAIPYKPPRKLHTAGGRD